MGKNKNLYAPRKNRRVTGGFSVCVRLFLCQFRVNCLRSCRTFRAEQPGFLRGFKQEEGRCFRVQAKLAYAISFHAEFALKERVKSGAGKLDCVGQRLKQRCGADLRPLQAA